MQNKDEITNQIIMIIIKEKRQCLIDKYIYIKGDYFVNIAIMVLDQFDEELDAKKGKSFYIPEKEELLKYKSLSYFEINKEYEDLLNFLKRMFFRKSKAEAICREIQMNCRSIRAMENLPLLFEEKKIRFRNTRQLENLMSLIRSLANNTRLWQNNGYTSNELSEIMEE